MRRTAIISVYDKSGLLPFAQGLRGEGFRILSSGGTACFLEENGVNVTPVSEYTGAPEICEGRVKTLHPKIHGGILARRHLDNDLKDLSSLEADPVDVVVVNLYPFVSRVDEIFASGTKDHQSLVEDIDIGGPTMLRAAAKNCKDVVVVCEPGDYGQVLTELRSDEGVSLSLRRELAAKVFRTMAAYDAQVARYFSLGEELLDEEGAPKVLAPVETCVLQKVQDLRYGENPHQKAALYQPVSVGGSALSSSWTQLQGKELSYNNLLDTQAALDLFVDLWDGPSSSSKNDGKHVSVVIKHLNPCGAATGANPLEAFRRARDCDPLSAFGGIIAVSGEVDEALAETALEGFIEVFLAEGYSEGARAIFKKKKNLRLMEVDFESWKQAYYANPWQLRNFSNRFLLQEGDKGVLGVREAEIASKRKPDEALLRDMQFAWQLCQHVKSNTIVVVKDEQAIGVGAGQMSRVDAARISVARAREHGHDPSGAVAASDAFLPFPDTFEILNDAGVQGLVQPGGSIKDEAVIECVNQRNAVMLMTGRRHFRH